MYHQGNRELQAHFGSEALADRLFEKTHRTEFTAADKAFVESCGFFFLATADGDAQPDCSFKGGAPGFVKVPAPDLLVYPDYDGNGMFKSLGNMRINAKVGLLFIAMGEKPKRLRVNGIAQLSFDDPLLPQLPTLYPPYSTHGAFGLCAPSGVHAGRAGMENLSRIQGCGAQTQTHGLEPR
jgi:predicted pyridoxine 5'-phosphate oxidase superfamily flavin-nucleotide-binding protein